MNDIEYILQADFLNFSPIFARIDFSTDVPPLDRIDTYAQVDNYFTSLIDVEHPDFANSKASAIKIPKGQVATIEKNGIYGIYTPKLPAALGGIACYSIGRLYPRQGTMIIFEATEGNPLVIEQNLTEDYCHVLYEYGERFSKTIESSGTEDFVPEISNGNADKIRLLEEELERLKNE